MNRKRINLLLLLVVGMTSVMLTACGGLFGEPDKGVAAAPEEIMGRYSEAENSLVQWVFLSDTVGGTTEYWGKTWDEGQDVSEADVDLDWHGNGWFRWSVEEDKITLIHQMNISSATTPKRYTITQCDKQKLVLSATYGQTLELVRK